MAPLQGPVASLRAVGGSGVLDLSGTVAFYELLGFRFPPLEAGTKHIEADGDVRLMIDEAAFLTELHGEPPRPGNIAGFAVLVDAPGDVDAAASRVADAGHTLVTPPYDAPWGQRYATFADPDGYRTDLFCPLPG
jgi:catechol 2,3-dioxygenase-like lactoylglutathione lyase family enzyme